MKNPSKKIVSAILSSTLILPTLSPCASAMGREKKPTPPNNESNTINSKKLIKSKITAEKSTTIENTTNEDTTENKFNQSSDTPKRIHENENETVFQSEVQPVEEPLIFENNPYKIHKYGNRIEFLRRRQPLGRTSFYENATVDTQIKVIDDSEENNQVLLDTEQAKIVYIENEFCKKISKGTALYNAISKGGYKSEYLSYDGYKEERIFNTENLCPVSKKIVYHYLNHKNYMKGPDISIWYAMYRILLCLVDGWNYEIIPAEDIIYICKCINHFATENSFDGLILNDINLNNGYISLIAKYSLLYSLDIIREKDSTERSQQHLAANFYVR